jgi:hypothetical protein
MTAVAQHSTALTAAAVRAIRRALLPYSARTAWNAAQWHKRLVSPLSYAAHGQVVWVLGFAAAFRHPRDSGVCAEHS